MHLATRGDRPELYARFFFREVAVTLRRRSSSGSAIAQGLSRSQSGRQASDTTGTPRPEPLDPDSPGAALGGGQMPGSSPAQFGQVSIQ